MLSLSTLIALSTAILPFASAYPQTVPLGSLIDRHQAGCIPYVRDPSQPGLHEPTPNEHARDFTIRGPVTIPSQKGNVDILLTVLNGWKNDIKNSKNMDDVVPDSTEFPWSPTAYELHLTQNKTPERMIWFNVMAAIDKMVEHYKAVQPFQKTVSLCEVYVMDDGLYLEGYITLITAGTTCGQKVETDDRGIIVKPALGLIQRAHT